MTRLVVMYYLSKGETVTSLVANNFQKKTVITKVQMITFSRHLYPFQSPFLSFTLIQAHNLGI